ncbi:hypothetical protein [Pseudoalteromonas luteoviolacea]|nr:hypothetical protein [Pseudoalteromonas luteoviolacea]MBQ4877223.1 hypothetical protein [Pseudoalteromonas luteoviolacea]MBQ4906084.1 hypothetical protein [Pseudoalteromonas luteoviolacea]
MFELAHKRPKNCIPLHGQTIYASEWPELVFYYTDDPNAHSVQLSDFRGEFVRGLDEGRGVDKNRQPRTWQADMVGEHDHDVQFTNMSNDGTYGSDVDRGNGVGAHSKVFKTTKSGGYETRPRNQVVSHCVIAGNKATI